MYSGFLATLLCIIGVALALAVVTRRRVALLACCLGVAGWALSLALALSPRFEAIGAHLLMVGFFVPASFTHAAHAATGTGRRGVVIGYAVAISFFGVGLVAPELFLRDGGRQPGPLFPLMFGAAALLSGWPLWVLVRGLGVPRDGHRERLRYLLVAGFLAMFGGGLNVLFVLAGDPTPLGLTMSLAGVGLLAWVNQAHELPSFGRFVERSLRYSLLAALLSTGWLFLVLVFLPGDAAPSPWRSWASAAQLFVLVLVGQPLLARLRGGLARRLFPGEGDVAGMARALAESEARAEHASRLAELGTLASAVAHEVRNPLGVMKASVRILERQGADPVQVGELHTQLDRAASFADELLEYGRPSPLSRRPVELAAVAALAASEVARALPQRPPVAVTVTGEAPPVQADLHQITRLFIILVENAALAAGPGGQVHITVTGAPGGARATIDDSGPGVPEAVRDRLFDAFVSGRGREGPRPGTGLGLAIARGVAHRHGGSLRLHDGPGSLGGARFAVTLPIAPPLPAGGQ